MRRLIAALAIAFATPAGAALPTPDKDDGGIKLPSGFRAVVVADDLGPLRFMTVAPNGDVYVKMQTVGIIALRDTDGDGRAETRAAFGAGGGTGIALRDGWLYTSTTTAVFRYKMTPGALVPKGEPELVVSGLPDENQHNSKSFAFDEAGMLYVEVGSPSNAYGSPDRTRGAKGQDPTEFLKTHGGFWRFDPSKPNQEQADGDHYSSGHRHVLAVARNPVSKAFFVVMMGRDQLNTVAPDSYSDEDNAEAPAEEMHVLREGGSLGWPFTYWDPRKSARMLAPEYGGDNQKRAEAGKYPDPLVAFPAHWAPLQMAFYGGDQFPAKYRGGAFVAFHGSWNRAPRPQRGYNVAFVPFGANGMPSGGFEVFADGFAGKDEFTAVSDARYRPCGLAVGPDGSLYVADSERGRVWRIFYTGETAGAAPAAAAAASPAAAPAARAATLAHGPGAQVYGDLCARCHMEDGSGVPNMQPPLTGRALAGDATTLIRLVLFGPDKVLPASRKRYENPMPELQGMLDDQQVADVLNYARQMFAKTPSAITAMDVAAQRAKP
jgi:glucose/arabinose dehydrogenase/mono/diheme cytochrome c family protein